MMLNIGASLYPALLLVTMTLTFGCFLEYEVPQIKHHRSDYLRQDDNLLDLLQILIITTLVILEFSGVCGTDTVTQEVICRWL